MRLPILLMFCASLCAAQPKTEIGEINGAKFRIDVPEKWNGGLIVYCHGYSAVPGSFDNPKPAAFGEILVSEGYAVAQSGYAAGGWAIQEAVQDTEALRRYFGRKYGAPKETFVTGHSMGGFLTMTLLEMFPNSYDGGLALCGPLADARWFMQRRVFDMRVVFDYYFPGALPSPVKVPGDFAVTGQRNQEIEKALEAQPEKAAAVRRWSGIKSNKELAPTLVFFTFILKDLQQRSGGNAFDNRNTIYEGTDTDDALNDGVARYKGDARAMEYLERYYAPTGRLARPMLAIHTTYDPLVPPWVTNAYAKIAEGTGSEARFVQQYVKRGGHCSISPQEIGRGIGQLKKWKDEGARPQAGAAQ